MTTLQHKDLLNAGVHFGHLTRKWHPNMAPFIFMERNGIHIIDLNKTLTHLQEATQVLKTMASAGKKILFVATKKQAKALVAQEATRLGMPYVTERWLGGTLTNFATIRRLLKKMESSDKLMKDKAYQNMAKKEQLMIARENAKMKRLLQGVAEVTRLPAALFIVDIKREHIAVKEAKKLGIPVIALTDTNTDPTQIDYPIPSNDDSSSAVELIMKAVGSAIEEGLAARDQEQAKGADADVEATGKGTRERNVEKITSSQELAPTTAQPGHVEKPKRTPARTSAAKEPKKEESIKVASRRSTATKPTKTAGQPVTEKKQDKVTTPQAPTTEEEAS